MIFFLVFPVVNNSVRISSESSTFATVCQTLKPHSHSYFHCVFLRGLPHFGQSTLAVSYTHLFNASLELSHIFNNSLHVLQNSSEDDYIPDIHQELLFLPQYVHSYGIPVSYTHLDVYKRQGLSLGFEPIFIITTGYVSSHYTS